MTFTLADIGVVATILLAFTTLLWFVFNHTFFKPIRENLPALSLSASNKEKQ